MTYAMVDIYCASYPRPPRAVTLDIDDTPDVVHGHQQLSLLTWLAEAHAMLGHVAEATNCLAEAGRIVETVSGSLC